MEQKIITEQQQQCISHCIFEFWSEHSEIKDPDRRDEEYAQCLTDCRLCG